MLFKITHKNQIRSLLSPGPKICHSWFATFPTSTTTSITILVPPHLPDSRHEHRSTLDTPWTIKPWRLQISSPADLISTQRQHHPHNSQMHYWQRLSHQQHSSPSLPSLPRHQRHRWRGKSIAAGHRRLVLDRSLIGRHSPPATHQSSIQSSLACWWRRGVQKKVSSRWIGPFLLIEWIHLTHLPGHCFDLTQQ
jgi:hypothetical protein